MLEEIHSAYSPGNAIQLTGILQCRCVMQSQSSVLRKLDAQTEAEKCFVERTGPAYYRQGKHTG